MRAHRLTSLLLVLVASALAGCGAESGGGGNAGADPANAMPADAAIYLELVVRPEGEQREQLTKLAGKLLRTDKPEAEIQKLVDKAFASGGNKVSYEQDLKPWLGRRAGMYLTGFEGDEPTFVVAIAAKDAAKAEATLEREAKADGDKKASYKGVDYYIDSDNETAAAFGDYIAVASNEAQIKRAIDANKGTSLAESDRFKQSVDKAPGDRAGLAWIDFNKFLGAIAKAEGGGAEFQQIFGSLGLDKIGPITVALLADEDTIALEAQTAKPAGAAGGLFSALSFDAPELIKELPGDSWGALGSADLGSQAKTLFDTFAGALGGAAIGGQLERQLGLNLQNDVFSWIGDVAVFVRGASLAEIDGAIVIVVKDQAKARAGITKLVGLARQQGQVPFEPTRIDGASLAFAASDPQLPKPIVVALAGEKAVVAFGEEAAKEAISPSDTLGDSDIYDKAKAATEDLEPSLLIDGPSVLKLVDTALASEPGLEKVRPYLDAIDIIAFGYKLDGDTVRQRFAVGVK